MIAKGGHYEPVAREGLPFIIPPFALALVFWLGDYPWTSLLFLLISAAIGLFFRNPERVTPQGRGIVTSPADGRVVEIVAGAESGNLEGIPLKRVSIFMSIFNVHVNRCPISGTVEKVVHVPGQFLDARESQASMVNEHNCVVLRGEDGPIEVVQIAGKIARRIACWISKGDNVRMGERFGLIRFGSRLDVYLPENFSFVVDVGNRVRSGETIIARKIDGKRSPGQV